MAASLSLSTTHSGVGSVGLPIPRSMMSIPATRFSYFILLMRPNRYGGRRKIREETSILKGCWLITVVLANALMICQSWRHFTSRFSKTVGWRQSEERGVQDRAHHIATKR